jgi:hypothetical protein
LVCDDVPPEEKLLPIKLEHFVRVSMKSRMSIIDVLGLGVQEFVDAANGFLQDEPGRRGWPKIEFIAEVKENPSRLTRKKPMTMEDTEVMGGMSRG